MVRFCDHGNGQSGSITEGNFLTSKVIIDFPRYIAAPWSWVSFTRSQMMEGVGRRWRQCFYRIVGKPTLTKYENINK
jgi:hypothetical protein